MEDLRLQRKQKLIEINGGFDSEDECYVYIENESAFLNKEEIQQVIDHLTELLKG